MRQKVLRLLNKFIPSQNLIHESSSGRRKHNNASITHVLHNISRELRDERGSAVVEFVVLTLPLFVPFALYLGFINSQSQAAFDAHNLARQAARAFVSSPSEDLTEARVNTIVDAFTSNVLAKHGISGKPHVSISCSATPCLTPGANVRATIEILDSSIKPTGYLRFLNSSPTKVSASDIQVVDIWRNTQ